ncbi:hypothetical protein GCM10023080_073070 [Streptomyces pseudoechinosporeus]
MNRRAEQLVSRQHKLSYRAAPRWFTCPAVGGHGEVAELITTFNTMLDRLEAERATSAARALTAQESERHRIAQELHDEIGQTLTAVLLDLKRVAGQAPDPVREQLHQVQITAGSASGGPSSRPMNPRSVMAPSPAARRWEVSLSWRQAVISDVRPGRTAEIHTSRPRSSVSAINQRSSRRGAPGGQVF